MKMTKTVMYCLVVMSILLGNSQVVKAENKIEEISYMEGTVDFVDEDGNVIATYIPYSEENQEPSKLGRSSTYPVDVSLGGYSVGYLSNIYSLNRGNRIALNIVIDPQVTCTIGLYNRNTEQYVFPAGGVSSAGWTGYLIVNSDGRYSLAFENQSNISTTFKGTYSL